MIWAMTANLNKDDVPLPPLGFWIAFNSRISIKLTVKSNLLSPPDDSILKDYFDFLIDLKDHLKIDYVLSQWSGCFLQNSTNHLERKEV